MSSIFKIVEIHKRSWPDGDDYTLAACLEGDGDDNEADYDYALAA